MGAALKGIAFVLGLGLLVGCYYDKEEVLYPNGNCDSANVTWSGTVLPLMQTRCAVPGCHVPGGFGPGDFNQYANVKTVVDNGRFQAEVIQAGTMPPSGKLGACDIQKLQAWIDAGAPNN
jgi:hypothetical protein